MNVKTELNLYQTALKNYLLGQEAECNNVLIKNIVVPKKNTNICAQKYAEKRIGVYRNNVIYSISEALGKLYPVTKRIVGDDYFAFIAKLYILKHPPEDAALVFYGEYFPDFIANSEACKKLLYIKDLALLEWHYQYSLHAADADVFNISNVSLVSEVEMAKLCFKLHPSLLFLESLYPVDQIWKENQKESVGVINLDSKTENYLLIYRKNLQVNIVSLECTVFHLLNFLSLGKPISEAWELAKVAAGEGALEDEKFLNIFAYLLDLSVFID